MDEAPLYSLRQNPPPDFAAELRRSLRRSEPATAAPRQVPLAKIAASLGVVVIAGGLLTIPAVRASAQSFLAMFRVVDFVAVPVGERNVSLLERIDLPNLLSEHVQVFGEAPPTPVSSAAEASAVAGYDVREPQWMPGAGELVEAAVTSAREVRVTADGGRLRNVMDALGITDLEVPPALHGQTLTIDVPPVVLLRYRHDKLHSRLIQAPSPVVAMPDGVDLTALGEIGLRIFGMSRDEARQLAGGIDWSSTLLVPLPPTAQSFRRIDVNGHSALAIQHQPPDQSPTNMILWSDGDRVFALMSLLNMSNTVQMALSVQ